MSVVLARSRLLLVAGLIAQVGLSPCDADAVQPRIQFDLAPAIECREVESVESAGLDPNEKLIEARFRVSVRIVEGREKDITELVFELTSPDRRLCIVDFSPDKELAADVTEGIKVTTTREKIHSLGASVGGNVAVPYGPLHATASPSANLGTTRRDTVQETAEKVAPKKVLVVAGTMNHQHGVFFKIKPSPHDSFEGMKEFTCRFIVPAAWRGDWAELTCRAEGIKRFYFFKSETVVGWEKLAVALYLDGDLAAKAATLPLAEAQGIKLGGAGRDVERSSLSLIAIFSDAGSHLTQEWSAPRDDPPKDRRTRLQIAKDNLAALAGER